MSKSVVFCYSQRFKSEGGLFIAHLRQICHDRGVYIEIAEPEFEDRPPEFLKAPESKRMEDPIYRLTVGKAVFGHLFKKVFPADVCFIFNKDGYLGHNTIGELFASAALGKHCYALDPRTLMGHYPDDLHEEPSAKELICGVADTPEKLFQRLV